MISMRKTIFVLAYLAVSALIFLTYGYVRPQPSLFEIVIFFALVVIFITGFAVLTNAQLKIKNNQVAYASGPIAALIGTIILFLPFAKDLVENVKGVNGQCDIQGSWNCIRCQYNDSAELFELTEGGTVRDVEMRQGGKRYPGSFLVDRMSSPSWAFKLRIKQCSGLSLPIADV